MVTKMEQSKWSGFADNPPNEAASSVTDATAQAVRDAVEKWKARALQAEQERDAAVKRVAEIKQAGLEFFGDIRSRETGSAQYWALHSVLFKDGAALQPSGEQAEDSDAE